MKHELIIPENGIDIPGPVDWGLASHWCSYNYSNYTVETWCKTGPDYRFKLRTRVRPMSESEVIFTKLIGHTPESVLKAYGVDLNVGTQKSDRLAHQIKQVKRWAFRSILVNILILLVSVVLFINSFS